MGLAANHKQIKTILDGIFDFYPRYSRLADEPAAVWCMHLESIPLEMLKAGAFAWTSSHNWPPDSVVKFKRTLNYSKRVVEPDPPGWAEFIVEHRAESPRCILWSEHRHALVDAKGDELPEPKDEPRTPDHKARVHWSIIKDIIDKKLRCPRSVAHHDIWATGDKEEQWYLSEFKRRMARN